MNILFLLDNMYTYESANVVFGRNVGNYLSEVCGHNVAFLVNCEENRQNAMGKMKCIFFCSRKEKNIYDRIKTSRMEGKGIWRQFFSLFKNASNIRGLLSLLFLKISPLEKIYRNKLENVCKDNQFDAVVSVSAPHYTMFALSKANISAKKICYMLDPYWSNSTMRYMASLSREISLYKKIDSALITDLMLTDNLNSKLKKYKAKMVSLSFPGVRKIAECESSSLIFDNKNINCVFIGNLYPDIRSPEYLLELFSRLPSKMHLFFIGGGREAFEKTFFEHYQNILGKRLHFEDAIPQMQAEQLIFQSDMLVNIGNKIKNQLPSKLLQYISSGKPILNVCKIQNCPSIKYIEKYPWAVSVLETDYLQESLMRVEEFCMNSKGKQASYDEIEDIFSDCTLSSVGNKIEEVILNSVQEMS